MTPFDWREFLQVAEWLNERPVDDAKLTANDAALRTVISRAYYAAFHVARTFVSERVREGELRWPGTRRSIHDQVWEALRSSPDPDIVALGIKGVALKQQRTEADYSVAPNKGRAAVARDATGYARDIIASLDELTFRSI